MVMYVKAEFMGNTSYFTISYLVRIWLASMMKAWGRQKCVVAAI
jgi:hypothetical protein